RGSWVFVIFMLAALTSISVLILPAEVNAWGYVAGAENKDTFNPVSYGQACGGGVGHGVSCHTVTEGYLSKSGADVTWGSQVPLGQPFSGHDPLWAWGGGGACSARDGSAIPTIVAGLFFDGVTLLLLYILVVIVRDTPSRRAQQMSAPAGADQGGAGRTHHPDRGHHGSGGRRPARRGRGKR